ncbi:hypothetical protein AVEN_259568-1 [Araneus ventricosus]|uniref:Uncharacterized protein n=1 Tax=Araneus ventricosus TaxID=182803 RepID=A0A4Y2EN57_ARAVE|nr:hypothetical protein AVEN_259568-1 [Araneus ventricosus]
MSENEDDIQDVNDCNTNKSLGEELREAESVEKDSEDFLKRAREKQNRSLQFVETIPNKNLKQDYKNTIKDNIVELLKVVAKQHALLTMVMGKYQVQKELVDIKLQKILEKRVTSEFSYAAMVSQSRRRSRNRKRDEGSIAIIYPKQEGEQFKVKQKVKSVINPAKLQIGIKNVKNINKGALLIECGNEEDLNKIKEEVESNELLKDEVAIRSPVKVNSKNIKNQLETRTYNENPSRK